jgi:hypothetical protein
VKAQILKPKTMKNQGFTNEELSTILQSLKNEGISSFNQSKVKASVYNKITLNETASHKPVLLSFNRYMNIFKPVMAVLALALFGYSGIRFASGISPLSPLYAIKEKANGITLSVLSEDKKIEKKFEITNEKLAAIKSPKASKEQVTKLSASVKNDLTNLSTDVKNIKDAKKLVALSGALENQTATLQKETNQSLAVTTTPTLPSDIKDAINKATNEILAVVYEAQSKSDNCPKYVADKMTALTANPNMNYFVQSKYSEVVSLLKEAKTKLENDDCLGALADLDTVESYKINIVIEPAK